MKRGEIDRVIQMAREDRTTFDIIRIQFGLSPGEVIKLMRAELNSKSFKMWRRRTAGRKTKHLQRRAFKVGRFRCPSQRG
ncbi:MAG: TIGR03643 family protein [Planctomycetota bacterium]